MCTSLEIISLDSFVPKIHNSTHLKLLIEFNVFGVPRKSVLKTACTKL